MPDQVCRFIHDLTFADLPDDVIEQARRCLLDLVGIAAAGSATELSRIIREYAAHNLGGDSMPTRMWFDGRAISPVGAALANASTLDAMDGHDGHRLAKGHCWRATKTAYWWNCSTRCLTSADRAVGDHVTTVSSFHSGE